MNDLISRQAAIATAISGRVRTLPTTEVGEDWIRVSEVRESLYAVPSIDAVPVIRCKDCKWWTKQEDSLQGRCALHGMYPTGEWFCANARREEE